MFLEDPKTGHRASISDNRLDTNAISEPLILRASRDDGLGFIANTLDVAPTLSITTTGGIVMYLKNDSALDMIVTRFIGSINGQARFQLYKNQVVGTLGNNVAHAPVNFNFGSANVAEATCWVWDEVGNGITGLTGGQALVPIDFPGAGIIDFEVAGTVIPRGSSLSIYGIGITATRELGVSVAFYYKAQSE